MLNTSLKRDMAENRVLIVGLGKTGLSCARYLAKKGYSVAVTDSRVKPPELDTLSNEYPDIAVFTGGFDPDAFGVAEQIIISPGVSLDEPIISDAIKQGANVISDIELFSQYVNAPVIAITGSNGKSTVTTLLGEMVQRAGLTAKLGGNLGTPVLELLSDTLSDASPDNVKPDFYILELSSFQLETTYSLHPIASVVLNVSADHMDRYRDISHYLDVKKKIYQGEGAVVVNLDDPLVSSFSNDFSNNFSNEGSSENKKSDKNRKIICFTLNEPGDAVYGLRKVAGCNWLARGEENLISETDMKIKGKHNLANSLAALALAEAIGLPLEKTIPCLSDFRGLPHRMQWLGNYNHVDWYNDSKATNVGATVAAVGALTGKVVLIAGGEGKGADFSPLKKIVEQKAKAVVLLGQDAELIAHALGSNVKVVFVENMEEAVKSANELADEGDSVLLAPACASFDMYGGFEERGLDFMNIVTRLYD
ncbi:MAG: UDP-N-acetylmuramoyl-L-alanine--D-glutamate ligase [Gammaproteobacteria bacterium]|nr:UDP-N-acetylmuramoyl-L-alanine--D-glutamate ligase [Gammaproteobacteria bacterium]